jgi:hypothetical protein
MIRNVKDKYDEQKEMNKILKIQMAKQTAEHRSQMLIQQQIQNN